MQPAMTTGHRFAAPSLWASGAVMIVSSVWPFATHAAAPGAPIVMVPHRAVYDMILGDARSGSSVTDVQGRMVFEITGSSCEGYTQNMRFVTRMSSAEGQPTVSDLRSTTFETGDATTFRFNGTQTRDQKPGEAAAGEGRRANRDADLSVDLTKPEKKKLEFGNKVYLPVQHSIALVAAGRSKQGRLKADLYDGSESGDKVYETTATLGSEVAPGGNKKLPVIKNAEVLDTLPSWPVSVSYYEKGSDKQDAAPAYELSFMFFENGVTRKLVIDYGEFSIKGDLKEITFLDPTPAGAACVAK
jgi:EipB-like